MAQQPPSKTATPPANPTAQTPPNKQGTTPDKSAMPPAKMDASKTAAAKNPAEAKTPLITRTFDGVELRGDFYPAPEGKGRKTPVLILLHAVGPTRLNSSRKDFEKLPEQLQKQGYAVLTFDFRGYGESKTTDAQDYLKYHQVRNLKNAEHIEAKDYKTTADLMSLINDLVAIKIWLNKKNNSGDCNSNLIGVIAAEQAAVVATAWIANELTDPLRSKEKRSSTVFIPGVGNVQNNNNLNPNQGGFATGTGTAPGTSLGRMEGDDIVCLVAVSSSNRLSDNLNLQLMERWFTVLREKKVATLALYGANDRDAVTFWNKAVNWIKPAKEKERYKNSGIKPIKNTSLIGAKLLLNDTLEVGKSLEEYLADTIKKISEMRLWTEQPGADLPMQIDIERLFR